MICQNCKETIPKDSVFCPSCGQKVEVETITEPIVKDSLAAFAAKETIENLCPYCGSALDQDAKFCSSCGKKLGESLAKKVEKKLKGIKLPDMKKTLGMPKRLIITTVSIIAVLALVIIVGIATNWFGATGPAVQVASAVKNTLTAENFSVDFDYTYNVYREYSDEAYGTAYVSLDPKKRELTVYADLTIDGESGIFAIYDGYYIIEQNRECWGEDISKQIDDFFDAYEEGMEKDGTWEELFDTFFPNATRDVIDFEILNDCISEYVKNLNNKKWLEENAGYAVKKNNGVTQYCLAPDIYDFLKNSIAQFEDAFIESSDYDDLYEEVRDLRSGSKYTDTEVVFGVKSGKLTEFSFDISGPYEGLTYGDEIHIEADFYDIGKTEIDIDELEDMLAEAKKNS